MQNTDCCDMEMQNMSCNKKMTAVTLKRSVAWKCKIIRAVKRKSKINKSSNLKMFFELMLYVPVSNFSVILGDFCRYGLIQVNTNGCILEWLLHVFVVK